MKRKAWSTELFKTATKSHGSSPPVPSRHSLLLDTLQQNYFPTITSHHRIWQAYFTAEVFQIAECAISAGHFVP